MSVDFSTRFEDECMSIIFTIKMDSLISECSFHDVKYLDFKKFYEDFADDKECFLDFDVGSNSDGEIKVGKKMLHFP